MQIPWIIVVQGIGLIFVCGATWAQFSYVRHNMASKADLQIALKDHELSVLRTLEAREEKIFTKFVPRAECELCKHAQQLSLALMKPPIIPSKSKN